ncbi:MAG: complex I NDUFA9 subunit family protein [Rhodobacteraceae bacterium]|nr:complex I NDUFA9 subunit family protein [Paracoccaceae bacterium]
MSKIATVFGGSGFVGRFITQQLALEGWRVRVAVRNPNLAGFVRPYGPPGQVEPIQANIRFDRSVQDVIAGSQAVVNCVGILAETPRQRFDAVHAEAAERVARLSAAAGVERLIHVSAIGASEESESRYARTKSRGEAAALERFSGAVVLRPSVVFGSEDQFFNRFAAMTRLSPVLPIVGAGIRFQPVFVGDVAAAAAKAVVDRRVAGIHELGGPDIATFHELMQKMLRIVRRRRLIVGIPRLFAMPMATLLDVMQFATGGLLSNGVLTRDQIRQLQYDNVVSGQTPVFEDLGIVPVSMDLILEQYLYRFRPEGQYTSIKESAEALDSDNRI